MMTFWVMLSATFLEYALRRSEQPASLLWPCTEAGRKGQGREF
ncbi:hypothetical protein Cadr_000006591 [Camelus dromedarius]|uniref:Uncharacterized protein n=1 Tax=Camelus dromedarius TaxID=9838 RepID=A0A5N4E6G3_CAMDR|nr:hypothetical protein Cadr_000006591 [Camelus dromedarius]